MTDSIEGVAKELRETVASCHPMNPFACKLQELADRLAALAPVTAAVNEWREAVLDQLSNLCMDCSTDTSPREVLRMVIDGHVAIATDPRVSDTAPRPDTAAMAEQLLAVYDAKDAGWSDWHKDGRIFLETNRAGLLAAIRMVTPASGSTDGESALWALRQILHDLPKQRDWLDPALEGVARDLVKRNPIAELTPSRDQGEG